MSHRLMLHIFLTAINATDIRKPNLLELSDCKGRYLKLADDKVIVDKEGSKFKFVNCNEEYCELKTDKDEKICYEGKKLVKCKDNKQEDRTFRIIPTETNKFKITISGKFLTRSYKCISVKDCSSNVVYLNDCSEKDELKDFTFAQPKDENGKESHSLPTVTHLDNKDELKEKLELGKNREANIYIDESSSSTYSSESTDSHDEHDEIHIYPPKPNKKRYKHKHDSDEKRNKPHHGSHMHHNPDHHRKKKTNHRSEHEDPFHKIDDDHKKRPYLHPEHNYDEHEPEHNYYDEHYPEHNYDEHEPEHNYDEHYPEHNYDEHEPEHNYDEHEPEHNHHDHDMDTGDLSKKRKEKTNTPKDLSIKGLINRIHELSKEVEKNLNCENKINASSPKCKTDDNDHKSLLDKLKNGNNDKSQQTTRTYINYQPGIGNSPSLKPDIYNQLKNRFGGHTPTSFNNPTTYIRKTSIPVLVCKNVNQHDC